MRVKAIKIGEWRNIRDIEINLSDDTSLVCLVGSNGTGKTHLLELISACAHQIGISSGVDIPRGNPLSDAVRNFSIEFFLAPGVSAVLDEPFGDIDVYNTWDRTLSYDAQPGHLTAGGLPDTHQAEQFASRVVRRLQSSQDVHYLALDADRSFPKRELQPHEMGDAYQAHWYNDSWNKSRSHLTTRTLYDEWIKYCLVRENRAANLFYQEARRSAETGQASPIFNDYFGPYRSSLRQIMPHLLFAGANQEQRAILFDTAGIQLRFDQLSAGEREIAFLVGQIDRFGLKNGLFLLDEPELHLNPDLVRTWVNYLAQTVLTGQVWLATHSLEAVEAAGLESTILLERDPRTRYVSGAGSLSNRPVLSALSRAVGTPAFSMSSLRFVFIEGEETIGERERYRKVTKLDVDTRFIECGSCTEVIRRLSNLRSLAQEAGQRIRAVGIVDQDWRTKDELQKLSSNVGLIILDVHEIENLFLDKSTLVAIASQNGQEDFDFDEAMRDACDVRAGGWIVQAALSNEKHRDISALTSEARARVFALSWNQIAMDIEVAMESVASLSGFDEQRKSRLTKQLVTFAKIYLIIRDMHPASG